MSVDWGHRHKEKIPFNPGINTFVGPPQAGKTARVQAFSVIGGTRSDMGVADPDRNLDGSGPAAKAVDMLLERGLGAKDNLLWWIHREDALRAFVAPMEMKGKKLQVLSKKKGAWVDLHPGGRFNRRAIRSYLEALPVALSRRAPAIPQGFSLKSMKAMLDEPARIMRFVEKHYSPDSVFKKHRKLHDDLFRVMHRPGALSAVGLGSEIRRILQKLSKYRKKAVDALNRRYTQTDVGLRATKRPGTWKKAANRKKAAEQILAMTNPGPDEVFGALKGIEDRVSLSLTFKNAKLKENAALSDRLSLALKGLLLVIGARDLGPIVLDSPGAYFEPADLVRILAPMLLDARESGTQFVVSVSNTNFPFAVDANALLVCSRDPREGRVGPFNEEASGGIENPGTALWTLENLDGGGDLFDRREQYYAGVLGSSLAEEQGRISDVLLSMSKRKKP